MAKPQKLAVASDDSPLTSCSSHMILRSLLTGLPEALPPYTSYHFISLPSGLHFLLLPPVAPGLCRLQLLNMDLQQQFSKIFEGFSEAQDLIILRLPSPPAYS